MVQNHVKFVRLQDKLFEQNYHHKNGKVFEPVVDIIQHTSEKITETSTEKSINSNKAIENLNGKILVLMNVKGLIAPSLASSLFNFP